MQNYQRIRDLREDADLTQKQVADKLFLHLTQYRRYERGESEVPLNIAINIAKLYNVSLDYIAGLSNDKQGLTKSSLNEEETLLIKKFRSLNDIYRGRVLERVDVLLNNIQRVWSVSGLRTLFCHLLGMDLLFCGVSKKVYLKFLEIT